MFASVLAAPPNDSFTRTQDITLHRLIARPPILEAMILSGNALLLEVPAAARSAGPVTQAPFQRCKPASSFTWPRAPTFDSGKNAQIVLAIMQPALQQDQAAPRLVIKTFIKTEDKSLRVRGCVEI
jgi:hypothetical protein